MTPERANQVALDVVRRILAAAHSFQVEVAGTRVAVTLVRQESVAWPKPIPGLDASVVGPWPRRALLRAEWDGGHAEFEVLALAGSGRREARVVLAIRILPKRRPLGFLNVGVALLRSDEAEVRVPLWFNLKSDSDRSTTNQKLTELVSDSGLPMLHEQAIELFAVRVEDGAVLPTPELAFERLVHVNLIKLDFFSRGASAAARGRPLVDVAALGIADEPEEEEDDEEEEERRYWVGGAHDPSEVARFVEGQFWQNTVRDAEGKGGRRVRQLFEQISEGDWFAIRELGAENQLVIRYAGEVARVEPERERIELKRLRTKSLYKGAAPRGSDAAAWSDLLVPVTRDEVVALIFGNGDGDAPARAWVGPRNLILYGPPGTGKTYRLRDDYRPRFTRESRAQEVDLDALLELSWYEVVAATLADLGGEAKAKNLTEHPFLKSKYQAKGHKAPLSNKTWVTLESHAIEESTTVNYARRSGELVFDKREDSTWFFPNGVPEEIAELVEQLRPRPAEVAEDYLFVTFHQSYAYEDFIEGIRPKTRDVEAGSEATLAYELEDGVFLRAANAAVRLAGFDGTVNDLCQRSREERRAVFENAPPFGVFVDEINRGNVSRIFGELITLIEEDKRLGAEGEIIVTLPYSRRKFGVPKNLCLVGTMNTADRSVEALDSALRRRFSFIECAPDYAVLGSTTVEGGVEIAPMLRTINARLEVLLDRDHLIGHAYFVPVRDEPTIAKLKEVFAMNILPLLSEYFYADLGRVGLVLGPRFVQRVGAHTALASFDHEAADQLAERASYRLTPIDSVSTADFRSIYESTGG